MSSILIKNGTMVTPRGLFTSDVKIVDGVVAEIGKDLDSRGVDRVIDASGLLVFPGVIDEHVHMREPGLEYKDDFTHGTRAAAKGGVTTVIEHPNTLPPVETSEAVEKKGKYLSRKAWVDFALLGVIHDSNIHEIRDMVKAGAVGFKVFMGPTTGNIPPPKDTTLLQALTIASNLGVTVAFHAEDNELIEYYTAKAKSKGASPELHEEARPPLAEVYSISKIAVLARATGASVHIVHVSSADAVEAVIAAREKGVKITAETCPHYLYLNRADYAKHGSLIKVNPPIRGAHHQQVLWEELRKGNIQTVGSDHAPHAPEEKNKNIWEAASGMPGVQTLFPLMLHAALERKIPLELIPKMLSETPARLFGLWPRKGRIEIGFDGDIVIVNPEDYTVVTQEWLEYKHKLSPYLGWRLRGKIVYTIVRGQVVYENGILSEKPVGEWVKPK